MFSYVAFCLSEYPLALQFIKLQVLHSLIILHARDASGGPHKQLDSTDSEPSKNSKLEFIAVSGPKAAGLGSLAALASGARPTAALV
jgi:hypothetical protein